MDDSDLNWTTRFLVAMCTDVDGVVFCVHLSPVRIGLNKRVTPGTRDRIFLGCVFVALAHAGYVMAGDSTMGAGT